MVHLLPSEIHQVDHPLHDETLKVLNAVLLVGQMPAIHALNRVNVWTRRIGGQLLEGCIEEPWANRD
ncbi:hypothetical protein QQP08_000943 [Theobroma cacao]|nr:hypothetical protein QQP08_000943 [Theobroma cacao]